MGIINCKEEIKAYVSVEVSFKIKGRMFDDAYWDLMKKLFGFFKYSDEGKCGGELGDEEFSCVEPNDVDIHGNNEEWYVHVSLTKKSFPLSDLPEKIMEEIANENNWDIYGSWMLVNFDFLDRLLEEHIASICSEVSLTNLRCCCFPRMVLTRIMEK